MIMTMIIVRCFFRMELITAFSTSPLGSFVAVSPAATLVRITGMCLWSTVAPTT
jgi:p-aminobenzoyl-glutamate transporter AbgT